MGATSLVNVTSPWAAVLAGVACMSYATFTFYNAAGGITWAVVFGALGYAFGRNLPLLEHYVAQLSLALVLLATLAITLSGVTVAFLRASIAIR